MKVICINDKNKPNKIPQDQWCKFGEEYTVIRVIRLPLQEDTMGLLFEEIQMDDSCFPYEFYDATRFAVKSDIFSESEESKEFKEADLDMIN